MITFIEELLADTFGHAVETDDEVVTIAIVDTTGTHMFGELK